MILKHWLVYLQSSKVVPGEERASRLRRSSRSRVTCLSWKITVSSFSLITCLSRWAGGGEDAGKDRHVYQWIKLQIIYCTLCTSLLKREMAGRCRCTELSNTDLKTAGQTCQVHKLLLSVWDSALLFIQMLWINNDFIWATDDPSHIPHCTKQQSRLSRFRHLMDRSVSQLVSESAQCFSQSVPDFSVSHQQDVRNMCSTVNHTLPLSVLCSTMMHLCEKSTAI